MFALDECQDKRWKGGDKTSKYQLILIKTVMFLSQDKPIPSILRNAFFKYQATEDGNCDISGCRFLK